MLDLRGVVPKRIIQAEGMVAALIHVLKILRCEMCGMQMYNAARYFKLLDDHQGMTAFNHRLVTMNRRDCPSG
jgi:hypothetical protein